MGSAEEPLPRTAFPWCEKRARRLDLGAAEDRLSDLPDCLLHDILSRLPSQQAVQTSTLSRRWRNLWRSVSCVDIDQRQFPGSQVPGSRQRWRFEDFADGMLASSSPAPLHAFRLHLVDSWSTSSERWLRRGLKRLPSIVDIHCNLADNKSIVEWPLSRFSLGADACRLTRLTLSGMTLGCDFVERLGALCPVLQELRIGRCQYHHSFCTIASPTLKSLAVHCRTGYSTLAIEAPRLASLVLIVPFGGTSGNPVITARGHEALASLVQASIYIDDQGLPNQRANKTKLEFLRSMCVFLARLSNVRYLGLTGFTTTALLDQESQEFPVFQNLTTLFLRCCDVGALNSQVLQRILDSTPRLEKIGLHHCKFSGRPGGRKRKTSSKQRVKTLDQHKNLSLIEIKYQPDDQTHWDKILGKCSKKTPQWGIVRKSYRVVPSTCVNVGRGEVSEDARITPALEMTMCLLRLRLSMCDPVSTTRTRVKRISKQKTVKRRATKLASPPTRTDNQIAPMLDSTDDAVLNTVEEVMRRTEDDTRT